MAQNHVQNGSKLLYENSGETAIASGAPVIVGARVGVALVAIPAGESGIVQMDEVFSLSKVTGSISQGANVYLIASNAQITTSASGNTLAGFAFEAAESADATVPVKLNA